MSDTPTAEQTQRAEWDLLLRDLELRSEQVRQTKAYEPRRLFIQAISAAAAVFVAGAAVGGLLLGTFGYRIGQPPQPIIIQLPAQAPAK